MNLVRKPTLTRSEQVRQRRVEESRKRITKSQIPVSNPGPYPVTVRGGSGARVHQRTQKRPRRQYYYSIGATGAEIRLPAIPSIRADWKWVSAGIALVMIIALFFFLNSSQFTISSPKTVGIQRVTGSDLEAVLRLQGLSIFELDTNIARTQLAMAFPDLKNIQIRASLPAAITIIAEERQPVLVWKNNDTTLWVDTEGVIIPPRGEIGPLPVIESDSLPPLGDNAVNLNNPATSAVNNAIPTMLETSILQNWGRRMDKNLLLTALKLTTIVPEGTTIAFSDRHGLGWMDTAGWYVYIGLTLDEIDLKMTEYQEIVKQVQVMGLRPQIISVETIHAPYLRMEQ